MICSDGNDGSQEATRQDDDRQREHFSNSSEENKWDLRKLSKDKEERRGEGEILEGEGQSTSKGSKEIGGSRSEYIKGSKERENLSNDATRPRGSALDDDVYRCMK